MDTGAAITLSSPTLHGHGNAIRLQQIERQRKAYRSREAGPIPAAFASAAAPRQGGAGAQLRPRADGGRARGAEDEAVPQHDAA